MSIPDLNPNPLPPPPPDNGSGDPPPPVPDSLKTVVADPRLFMLWTNIADYVPGKIGDSSGGGGQAPHNLSMSIDLSALRTVEETMLGGLTTLVELYDLTCMLAKDMYSTGSLFGEQATYQASVFTNGGMGGGETYQLENFADGIQPQAKASAPVLIHGITAALANMANALVAAGEFLALLQVTGVTYTTTDYACAMPDPHTPPPPPPPPPA
jgi:hypothetical protein